MIAGIHLDSRSPRPSAAAETRGHTLSV